ncbi:hypothetical protein NL676_008024 [Syzygium grande]|nr:hypothetical protein NL676_008024 [Syzygium grande]
MATGAFIEVFELHQAHGHCHSSFTEIGHGHSSFRGFQAHSHGYFVRFHLSSQTLFHAESRQVKVTTVVDGFGRWWTKEEKMQES